MPHVRHQAQTDRGGREGLMSTWLSKLGRGLVVLLVLAVAARAIWALLGPLLPDLLILLVVGGLLVHVILGSRSSGGPFHG
jgi:hypothetical protein